MESGLVWYTNGTRLRASRRAIPNDELEHTFWNPMSPTSPADRVSLREQPHFFSRASDPFGGLFVGETSPGEYVCFDSQFEFFGVRNLLHGDCGDCNWFIRLPRLSDELFDSVLHGLRRLCLHRIARRKFDIKHTARVSRFPSE